MPDELGVRIEPVQENRDEVAQLLVELLGPDSRERAEELVEEGGVAATDVNRTAIDTFRDRLAELGVEPTVVTIDDPDDAKFPDMLVGRVRGIRSGLPVAGATVRIQAASDGTELGQATSTDDGRFRLPEFGTRLREHSSLTRPQLEVTVTRNGQSVESRHKPFDWEAFAAGDYVFDIEAAPPDSSSTGRSTDETVYRVHGQVTSPDGSPIEAVTVRAYDRDLRSEEVLGSTTTDGEGHYEIEYLSDAFTASERGGPDLLIRVFDETAPDTTPIGSSETQFNAGPDVRIDVELDPERPTPTEYARLVAELAPLRDGVAPADLTADNVEFLIEETAIAERTTPFPAGADSIRLYASAAELAAETGLSTEFFYGLGRQDLELTRAAIQERPFAELEEAITAAVEASIVSESVLETIGRARSTLRGPSPDRRDRPDEPRVGSATVYLRTESGETPLVDYDVRIDPMADTGSVRRKVTDETGAVRISFTLRTESEDSTRTFALTVLDDTGEELHATELALGDGAERTVDVPTPTPGFDTRVPLSQLGTEERLGLSDAALEALGDRTLSAVRAAGGIEGLDVSASAVPDAEKIDALATLTLTTDPERAATLYENGYTSLVDIAADPPEAFVESVAGDRLTTGDAERIHAQAQAQVAFLDDVILAERKAWANRRRTIPSTGAHSGGDRR